MSNNVKIPVSADATRAISEMERFTGAIRKAGQEGRRFVDLDFSHPEMKQFADTMQEAQRRFDEIVKAGRGATADKLRGGIGRGAYSDVLGWWQHLPKDPKLQDPRLRERHMTNVMSGMFAGTPLQPTVPGGGSPDGKPGGGGFGLPGIGGGIGSLLRWALPLVGLAKVGSMAAQGLGDATDEAIEISALRRSMGVLANDFESFRGHLRQSGEGLGITYQETVKLTRAFTNVSGVVEERAAFASTRDAVGFARATGMDPAQTVGRFGRAQWLQAGGKTADTKELAYLFADAISAGEMFSKADEVMDAITSWVASSERVMVDAPNTRDYAALQAAMNASNRPGLQGQAGAALLNQVDSAIRGGGGAGDAGQNFLYRIMAGAGVRDPFEMQYRLENGAFEKLGDGRTIFQAVQEALKQQYANPLMRASAGGRLLNMSMHQYQALEGLNPADLDSLGTAGKRLGFDPSKLDTSTYLDVAMLGRKDLGELQKYRNHMLRSRGGELTEQQRTALGTNDEGELRDALIKTVAAIGMAKDLGRQAQEATIDIKNNIAELAGRGIPLLTGIKKGIDAGFGLANDAADYLGQTPRVANPIIEQYEENHRFKGGPEASGKGVPKVDADLFMKTFPGQVPGAMAPRGDGSEVTFKAEPLEVIHRDANGTPFKREDVQTTVLMRPAKTR